jgi:peptidoglycan hydrolase-like protein with peptidoglycan-binding domain
MSAAVRSRAGVDERSDGRERTSTCQHDVRSSMAPTSVGRGTSVAAHATKGGRHMTGSTWAMALGLAALLATPALAHDTERMSRSEVRRAQQQLEQRGYEVGTVDGVIGPKTQTAIRNFQRDKGLNATGELNEETRAALDEGRGTTAGAPAHHDDEE